MSKFLKEPVPFKVIGGKVTVDQAAWMTGKSNQAIYNAIKDGRMTADIDERDGKSVKVIQLADLERLYQNLRYPDEVKNSVNDALSEKPESQIRGGGVDATSVFEMLEKRFKDQLQQYEQEVEYLRETNNKSQDTLNNMTKMLEDHRQRDEKEGQAAEEAEKKREADLLKKMTELFEQKEAARAEKENAMKETIVKLRNQNRRILKAMQDEQEKSLWQKIFKS